MPASFQLNVAIREHSNGDQVAFKVDGQRFEGAEKTLKFSVDSHYDVRISARPSVDVRALNIAGFDLDLKKESENETLAVWNTSGMEVSKKGTRQNITLVLRTPQGTLTKQLQSKFYPKEDSHADWGHKLTTIEWKCTMEHDVIHVVEENFR
ncbi:unnamed protein product [Caenorhabditis auriculariae]|uniref:CB1 cannabinoid receptor-interacting protein 1 n=1 Tax=Caenorhabditis auriculariae TaxID=2777116 RepID=A0A8S1HUB0_9PELO|nr:unnamed protein product [Caenorhabditis auriculariae]